MKMQNLVFIAVTAVVVGFAAVSSFAHNTGYMNSGYNDDKVKTEVKTIDNGLQITVTSNDKEVARKIKENATRYEHVYSHGNGYCGYTDKYNHDNGRYGHHGMMMGW